MMVENATMTPPGGATIVADPFRAGLAAGWKVIDASRLSAISPLDCDVCIVGSGAGGGVAAEMLARRRPRRRDPRGRPAAHVVATSACSKSEAYPDLYQESAARKTADKAINILQGRCVGGGTTVNWTSSFRTPAATLAYWARVYRLDGYSPTRPGAVVREAWKRGSSIAPWEVPPNENNAALARGAAQARHSRRR